LVLAFYLYNRARNALLKNKTKSIYIEKPYN